jgi:hypothetical protein
MSHICHAWSLPGATMPGDSRLNTSETTPIPTNPATGHNFLSRPSLSTLRTPAGFRGVGRYTTEKWCIVFWPTQRRSADQRPVQELAELLPRHVPVPELADNLPLPLALRLPLPTRTWTRPLLATRPRIKTAESPMYCTIPSRISMLRRLAGSQVPVSVVNDHAPCPVKRRTGVSPVYRRPVGESECHNQKQAPQ